MAKLAIIKENSSPFDEEQYIVDTQREFGGAMKGDLICSCTPFFGVPIELEIAIRTNGDIIFRKWQFISPSGENSYLHTHEKPAELCNKCESPFIPTCEQTDTVNGLFSGRVKFEGLELLVGATLQYVCPINKEREEELIGQKIYLNK